MASVLDAVIYLRDIIYDNDCDCEKNIEIDEARSKLWFISTRSSLKSPEYDLYATTPLLSPTSSSSLTLYQLYVFAKHYLPDRDWADYIIEAKLIDPRVVIENSDCDALCSFLNGTTNTFAHSHKSKVPAPKRLNISTMNTPRKRKNPENEDGAFYRDDNETPSKRPRVMKREGASSLSANALSVHSMKSENAGSSSLFTEDYGAMMASNGINTKSDGMIGSMNEDEPFWRTLPDPVPKHSVDDMDGGRDVIDWKTEWRSRVRESATRNSMLNSQTKSFQSVAPNFSKISKSLRTLMSSGTAATKKPAFMLSAHEKTKRSRTEKPIIIVPESNRSPLTWSNALEFLSKNRYVAPHSLSGGGNAMNTASGIKGKEKNVMVLQRKSTLDPKGRAAEFEIRSSSSFGKNTPPDQWNRVAAIFVIGKSWQFKKWGANWRSPEVIFNKTAGFHLHFSDDAPSGDVKDWRVTHLGIERMTRHGDGKVAHAFWKKFYSHLQTKHKNKKLYY